MKIVALADTHGSNFLDKVPKCDLLLIGGDISPVNMDHSFYAQKMWFETTFIRQLKDLRDRVGTVVFIGGNHDTFLGETHKSKQSSTIQGMLPVGVYYLCDSSMQINGLNIYGSPWCNKPTWARSGPPVWNFTTEDAALEGIFEKIPENLDILLTHGPAYGFCDELLDQGLLELNAARFGSVKEHLGSPALMARIIKVMPKYVISGHLHSAQRNFATYKAMFNGPETKFACVSILDESYKFNPDYKVLEIEK